MTVRQIAVAFVAALVILGPARCRCAAESPKTASKQLAAAERLAEIAAAQTDKGLSWALQQAVKDPTRHYSFMHAVERAYNLGNRALAFELMDIGVALVVPEERGNFLRMRRAIWQHEADLDALAKSWSAPLEDAIAHPDAPFPADLADDPVMFQRLLPRCMEAYAANPAHGALFEFLRRTLSQTHDDASRERVLRLRLAALPADEGTLSEFTWMLQQAGRHEAILALDGELDPRVIDTLTYRLYRAESLAALGRKDEALAAADALAVETAKTRFYWDRIAGVYLACGLKEKAAGFIKQRAWPGDQGAARLLAKCGDAAGVRAVVQQAIDRGAYAGELLGCREACRAIGDEALAEKLFDAAEKQAIDSVRRSQNPFFNFSHEVRSRYEQEGRMERLAAALLPLYPEEERAAFIVKVAGGLIGDKRPQGIALMEKYREAYGADPEFKRVYDWMLKLAKDAEERRRAEASGTPPAPPKPPPPPDPTRQAAEIAALRARTTSRPDDAQAHAGLGLRLIAAGEVEAGRAEVRRAVALGAEYALVGQLHFLPDCDPDRAEGPAYWEVRNSYLDRGLRAEIEGDMAPLLARTPAHRAAHLEWVARWLEEHGRKAEADALTQEAKKLNPYLGVWVRW